MVLQGRILDIVTDDLCPLTSCLPVLCFPETLFPCYWYLCIMLPPPPWYPWSLGVLLMLVLDFAPSHLQTVLLLLILSELNIPMKIWVLLRRHLETCGGDLCHRWLFQTWLQLSCGTDQDTWGARPQAGLQHLPRASGLALQGTSVQSVQTQSTALLRMVEFGPFLLVHTVNVTSLSSKCYFSNKKLCVWLGVVTHHIAQSWKVLVLFWPGVWEYSGRFGAEVG